MKLGRWPFVALTHNSVICCSCIKLGNTTSFFGVNITFTLFCLLWKSNHPVNMFAKSGLITMFRYGEEAAQATNEGLDAAGHALGTAWTVFKLRKALNPKGALKPTTLAKAAVGKVKKSL